MLKLSAEKALLIKRGILDKVQIEGHPDNEFLVNLLRFATNPNELNLEICEADAKYLLDYYTFGKETADRIEAEEVVATILPIELRKMKADKTEGEK